MSTPGRTGHRSCGVRRKPALPGARKGPASSGPAVPAPAAMAQWGPSRDRAGPPEGDRDPHWSGSHCLKAVGGSASVPQDSARVVPGNNQLRWDNLERKKGIRVCSPAWPPRKLEGREVWPEEGGLP